MSDIAVSMPTLESVRAARNVLLERQRAGDEVDASLWEVVGTFYDKLTDDLHRMLRATVETAHSAMSELSAINEERERAEQERAEQARLAELAAEGPRHAGWKRRK